MICKQICWEILEIHLAAQDMTGEAGDSSGVNIFSSQSTISLIFGPSSCYSPDEMLTARVGLTIRPTANNPAHSSLSSCPTSPTQ